MSQSVRRINFRVQQPEQPSFFAQNHAHATMASNNGSASTNKRSLSDEAEASDVQPVTSKRRDDGSGQPRHINGQAEESSSLKSMLLTGDDGADDEAAISSFFQTTWQVEPRVYRRIMKQDVKCPLTRAVDLGWDGLASLLERSRKRFDSLNIDDDDDDDDVSPAKTTAAAGTLDPPLFFRNQTPVQFPEVRSMYNSNPFAAYLDGCSVVLNHADQLCPELAALCEDLQISFPHCYCNGYLTPPGAQAVPPHADDRDVLVVQLLGEKVWKVYKEVPIPYPYAQEQVGKGGLDVPAEVLEGATAIETTLRQGDILYMPRGWVHEARTESNHPSFHATVAIATHDWTLAGNMTEIISRTLASNPSLRLAVDRRIGNSISGSTSDATSDGCDLLPLQDQIDSALDEIRKNVSAPQIARQLGVKYATQRRMCQDARMALIRSDQSDQTSGEEKVGTAVGPEASRRVFMGTIVRAATDKERASVTPPPRPAGAAGTASDRGLTVREETSLALMTIVQRLKCDRSLKVKVSDLPSLFEESGVDESSIEMVCTLSIMCFIRAAVELGAVAVVE